MFSFHGQMWDNAIAVVTEGLQLPIKELIQL